MNLIVWSLTVLSSQGSLQHHTFLLQILKIHLNLLQPSLDGLLPIWKETQHEHVDFAILHSP